MSSTTRPGARRAGMTLIELVLALSVTAMVATAITAMLNAMSTGVVNKRDSRSLMVRAHAAESRLSAYIAPARCILDADDDSVVVWFDDSRESETVHATEIRWLVYDKADDAIDAYWVSFPAAWTQAAKDMADVEYDRTADWAAALTTYSAQGNVASLRLLDAVASAAVSFDQPTAQASRHVVYDLGIVAEGGMQQAQVAATVMVYQAPIK